MKHNLTREQQEHYQQFIQFANEYIVEQASNWEYSEALSPEIIAACAAQGFFGAAIPREYGGAGWDIVTYGLLNEALGGASISLTGLLNVHTMLAQTLLKWGTEEQRQRWLPAMARGEVLGAFALTEPEAGSDVQMIKTRYQRDGDDFIITGTKKWITAAGIAHLFLLFGKVDEQPVATLVERETPGVMITPLRGMLGFKASHLARIQLDACRIPTRNVVGRPGFALSYIAPYALEYGRVSVAFAALGMLRAALEICGKHVLERISFQRPLIEHGAISALIADMGVDLEAANALCLNAVNMKDQHHPDATEKIMIAKYFTTRASAHHCTQAVQIMGALGCNEDYPLARFYRDSKTMEIIEGSTQIHQFLLGKSFAMSQRNKQTTQRIRIEE